MQRIWTAYSCTISYKSEVFTWWGPPVWNLSESGISDDEFSLQYGAFAKLKDWKNLDADNEYAFLARLCWSSMVSRAASRRVVCYVNSEVPLWPFTGSTYQYTVKRPPATPSLGAEQFQWLPQCAATVSAGVIHSAVKADRWCEFLWNHSNRIVSSEVAPATPFFESGHTCCNFQEHLLGWHQLSLSKPGARFCLSLEHQHLANNWCRLFHVDDSKNIVSEKMLAHTTFMCSRHSFCSENKC